MDAFIGTIILWPVPWVPTDWALCDGRLLPIQQYPALFSLLGTRFGGDGMKTFALPKLAGPESNLAYIIALNGLYPPRD